MSLAHDEHDDHSMEGRKNHGCYAWGWHICGWHLMRWLLQNLYISQIILLLHKILFFKSRHMDDLVVWRHLYVIFAESTLHGYYSNLVYRELLTTLFRERLLAVAHADRCSRPQVPKFAIPNNLWFRILVTTTYKTNYNFVAMPLTISLFSSLSESRHFQVLRLSICTTQPPNTAIM